MLLRVQVDVLEGAVIYFEVNVIDEQELVSLDLVAHKDLDDVVLVDESHNFGWHSSVALDVVGAAKDTQLVHWAQFFDQRVVSIL